MSDLRSKPLTAAGAAARRAAGRRVRAMIFDQESPLSAKMAYLRGLVMGKGWKVEADQNVRFTFHILDQDGKDLSGAKTLQAAIEFVEEEIEKERD